VSLILGHGVQPVLFYFTVHAQLAVLSCMKWLCTDCHNWWCTTRLYNWRCTTRLYNWPIWLCWSCGIHTWLLIVVRL